MTVFTIAQDIAQPAPIVVRSHADLGDHLVNGEQMTLYLFVNTSMGAGPDRMTEGIRDGPPTCADAWPPLLTDGAPEGGPDVDRQLPHTTERDDGTIQVVCTGCPLFLFVNDVAAGDVSGQAIAPPSAQPFGATWYYVFAPDGSTITTTLLEDTAPAGGGGGGGGGTGGYY